MSKPVDRFCQVISELPEQERKQVVSLCCINMDAKVGLGEAILATIDTLRASLNRIIASGVQERFIITATFCWLIDRYKYQVNPESISESIDVHLDTIEGLKKQIQESDSEYAQLQLADLSAKVKSSLAKKDEDKATAEFMIEFLKQKKRERFHWSYWNSLPLK